MELDLNGTDNLSFTLSSDEGLSFDLASAEVLEFTISTPHALDIDVYDGDFEVTPKTYSQTLETEGKYLRSDIVINEIPYFETSNDSDGLTVYIANTLA